MPSERQLLEALDKDTVDTSRWTTDNSRESKRQMELAGSKMYGIAIPQVDGTLRAWHVTDDPEKVIDLLKTKGDFYARAGDLCGGLYVSAVPHYWEGRSQKKWDFLPKMSKESRFKLYEAIHERLLEEIKTGYITRSEFERASQDMDMAKQQDFWQILDIVANQPFNIDIPRLAEKLGLAVPFKPPYIQVDFVGRYLEFNTSRAIEANEALLLLKHGSVEGLSRLDLCNMLKEYGWDGVYTKASMGTSPELVIWNGDRVMAFGDYIPGSGSELSGIYSRDFTMTDPTGRFVVTIKADGQSSSIKDSNLQYEFKNLRVDDLLELRTAVRRLIDGEKAFTQGRFKADPIHGDRLIDLKETAKTISFMGMTSEQLSGLRDLINKTLEAMLS